VFFAALPLIFLGIVSAMWAIIALIKRNFYDYKVKTVSTTIVIFCLMHPSIARIYFVLFNCIDVQGE
jgi:prolipoprotein diacylglyceryltransferase